MGGIIYHISYFKIIFQKKKKKKHEFTGKNPFRAFGPARWRGISPHMWICPENFQESAGQKHIKMGPDISTGGDRYLKNGIESRVQNLSIAARYDQTFASGVPLPVGKSQKPKLKSGSRDYAAPPKIKKSTYGFSTRTILSKDNSRFARALPGKVS